MCAYVYGMYVHVYTSVYVGMYLCVCMHLCVQGLPKPWDVGSSA